MTTDFWTRVLAEYDAGDPAGEWALCCASPTFFAAYNTDDAYAAIDALAGQFLTNTDAGQHFSRGHVYLFRYQQRSERTDDEFVAAQRAVRRDFLLWARDNDTDGNATTIT